MQLQSTLKPATLLEPWLGPLKGGGAASTLPSADTYELLLLANDWLVAYIGGGGGSQGVQRPHVRAQ